MENLSFYDLSTINCWIVYQMPFNKEARTTENIINHQNFCIKNNFFAMGWPVESSKFNKNFNDYINDEDEKNYLDAYGTNEPQKALENFMEIKKNDYVVMRGKNAHFYIGKVKNKLQYLHKDDGNEVNGYMRLSWGCYVEKWLEFKSESDLPHELVGRFSQRLHSTIQKINTYRLKFLIIQAYLSKTNANYNIVKVKLNQNNFARSLCYEQLEDLVSLYIMNKHKNEDYLLMPSSCKISEQKYEFFFKAPNKKPLTCQVKNQEEIDIEKYKDEYDYEKIYIFSGIWDDDKINELNEDLNHNPYNNIYIISRAELFNTLCDYESYLNLNSYYEISNDELNLNLNDGFCECKRFNKNRYFYYKKDKNNDFISFYKDCLFYSKEFNSFFLSRSFKNDSKITKIIFNKIKENNNDLNIKKETL